MLLTTFLRMQPLSLPYSVIEICVMLQSYLLAVYFTIVEFIFHLKYSFSKELFEKDVTNSQFNKREHKIAVVTGGDGTIGRQIVVRLLSLGWEVHTVSHDLEHSKQVFSKERAETTKIRIHEVNLEDLEETSVFANQLTQRLRRIDLVVCGAAILFPKNSSKPGFQQNCVNIISQALFLQLLQPSLALDCRIMMISSCCSRGAFYKREMLTGELLYRYYGPFQTYGFSKLLMTIYAQQLAKDLSLSHPASRVCSVHPGVVPGSLYRGLSEPLKWITYNVLPYVMRSADWAALICLHTVLRDDIVNEAYYEDTRPVDFRPEIGDQERRLIFEHISRIVSQHLDPTLPSTKSKKESFQ